MAAVRWFPACHQPRVLQKHLLLSCGNVLLSNHFLCCLFVYFLRWGLAPSPGWPDFGSLLQPLRGWANRWASSTQLPKGFLLMLRSHRDRVSGTVQDKLTVFCPLAFTPTCKSVPCHRKNHSQALWTKVCRRGLYLVFPRLGESFGDSRDTFWGQPGPKHHAGDPVVTRTHSASAILADRLPS